MWDATLVVDLSDTLGHNRNSLLPLTTPALKVKHNCKGEAQQQLYNGTSTVDWYIHTLLCLRYEQVKLRRYMTFIDNIHSACFSAFQLSFSAAFGVFTLP